MTHKEIIDRAYGHIPKEISMSNEIFAWIPARGIKYYWYILIRKFRIFK